MSFGEAVGVLILFPALWLIGTLFSLGVLVTLCLLWQAVKGE